VPRSRRLMRRIVQGFVQRRQLEVTHRDVREHLGVETQRQWSPAAIARATPVLFGLYSLVTLRARPTWVSLRNV
jgi:hypothetical protein